MKLTKLKRRKRIHSRVRKHIIGTAQTPRLSVFRSNKGIYVQLIDDSSGHTLASASHNEVSPDTSDSKLATAREVGKLIGDKALEKDIKKIVFDRSGYLYHGRVKSLAEGVREKGLIF